MGNDLPLLSPPTPGFRKGFCYRCEPIPGSMVVYDEGGLAWAGDMLTFREYFEITAINQY